MSERDEKKVYTMQEIQSMLGVSKTKVYQMAQKNIFPVLRIGRNYYVPIRAFDNWLESCGNIDYGK